MLHAIKHTYILFFLQDYVIHRTNPQETGCVMAAANQASRPLPTCKAVTTLAMASVSLKATCAAFVCRNVLSDCVNSTRASTMRPITGTMRMTISLTVCRIWFWSERRAFSSSSSRLVTLARLLPPQHPALAT